ncbi:MAG: hypothetical protein RIT27_2143 [Pseudomonadota bacterium]|jgi:bacterioferritin-associated ferredoxin
MYVCICQGVTDRQIRDAVCAGNCTSMRQLCQQLGVIEQCGRCGKETHQILRNTLTELNNRQG